MTPSELSEHFGFRLSVTWPHLTDIERENVKDAMLWLGRTSVNGIPGFFASLRNTAQNDPERDLTVIRPNPVTKRKAPSVRKNPDPATVPDGPPDVWRLDEVYDVLRSRIN